MPIAYVCECGKKTTVNEDDLAKLGIVIERYYCDDCYDVARLFLEGRDALQEKCAATWAAGLKKLRAAAQKAAPGVKLPDTADG